MKTLKPESIKVEALEITVGGVKVEGFSNVDFDFDPAYPMVDPKFEEFLDAEAELDENHGPDNFPPYGEEE